MSSRSCGKTLSVPTKVYGGKWHLQDSFPRLPSGRNPDGEVEEGVWPLSRRGTRPIRPPRFLSGLEK
ncbi:hypothetical protein Pmani_017145 [Petrolisthes manimaculis]|uniref:Uncharacterized protein n=1 Tax=Petrolisthes manimaculis TaxID=1843537 RepID=A0AAE1U9R2_9EUCA|nr:hypothetical protein Pmani_017145 [Petrolisthes manimaculis]